ncbi:indole-3-glycerol phosphate synthase TrpC [Granulicella sp. dw_53]|uniref:indole-3-glycerol phosphate synthase TrpC n=1 Tax=Granulicella sp. dw_53 TaxID=2719792 RepID=UPI001BD5D167
MSTQTPKQHAPLQNETVQDRVQDKPDILAKIEIYKRREVLAAKEAIPADAMRKLARQAPAPRGFAAAIERHLSEGRPALIAEIKKASPSKGLIRPDFDPPSLARAYVEGGASCLSVLTDEPSFQGHPDFLRLAREASGLPVLRKDFLFEPYQVDQARAWGADCILVIMASVTDAEAWELVSSAHDLGMDVLVEVHNALELERALPLGTKLVGINNRDLRSFEVSLDTTEKLAAGIPKDRIIVSESGISNHSDIVKLSSSGVRTFLVGESLMRQSDVTSATKALLFG